MAMNALARCGHTFRLLFFLLYVAVTLLIGSGCKPVFEDTSCEVDSDCFTDQYCSVSKTCLIKSVTRLKISSFVASPESADAGSEIDLSWKTQGGTAAFIEGPDDYQYTVPSAELAEGSVTVTLPDAPGQADYAFVLTWDDLEKRETLTVSVSEGPPPVLPIIESFEADTEQIDPGALVNLSWQVTDASMGELLADGAVVHTLEASELAEGSFSVTPSETTTYELSVSNEDGEDTSSLTITVNPLPRPTINSFTTSSTQIILGESITLSWDVQGADSISIRDAADMTVFESQDDAVVAMGFVELSPTLETSYTLTAYNLQGDTSASTMNIIVESPPVIHDFAASKTVDVVPGEAIELTWDVSGANTIEIRDQDDALVIDSMDATGAVMATTSSSTTSYTLLAINGAGEVSEQIDIALLGAPSILSFTASKQDDLLFNENITLSWEVSEAVTVEIRDQTNATLHTSNMATGSFSLDIQADTTFTLVAQNPTADASQDLTVTLLKVPVINAFTASKTTDVSPGEDVDFSWDVSGADTIEISAAMSSLHSSSSDMGSVTLAVPDSAIYTLTATNAAGSITRDISIDVLIVPSITSFSADVTTVPSGGAVTLSWTTQDAVSLQILDNLGGAPIAIMMADVASGSVVLRPQVSTSYTLRAQGQGAASNFVEQTIDITVVAADLLITEVLFAPDAPVSGRQWVELYNAGDTFVDLSHYSLGWSGLSSFADFRQALEPVLLAPGETYVIGDVSDVGNHAPAVQQQTGFTPALGDGVASADGVALLFLEAQDVTPTSRPVDSVLWGSANTKMLLAEDGSVDTEVTPIPSPGSSIVRVSASTDVFADAQGGFPNTPFFVTQVSPSRVPNTATQGEILIEGYGFELLLDDYFFGATPLLCSRVQEGLSCQLDLSTPSSDVGSVSFEARRLSAYVQDAQGNTSLAPRVMPLVYVRPDSLFFEALLIDNSADFECATRTPAVATAMAGTSIEVEVEIYDLGFTDMVPGGLAPGAILQVGLFDPTTTPYEQMGIVWQDWDAGLDSQSDGSDPALEVFAKQLSSATPAVLEAVFRISEDGGTSWTYCNAQSAGGSQAGWVSGVSLEWTN